MGMKCERCKAEQHERVCLACSHEIRKRASRLRTMAYQAVFSQDGRYLGTTAHDGYLELASYLERLWGESASGIPPKNIFKK